MKVYAYTKKYYQLYEPLSLNQNLILKKIKLEEKENNFSG
jgi:hypothetical protein